MEPVGVNGHTGPDKTEAGATVGRLDPDVHVRTTVVRCIIIIRRVGHSGVRHDDCMTIKVSLYLGATRACTHCTSGRSSVSNLRSRAYGPLGSSRGPR